MEATKIIEQVRALKLKKQEDKIIRRALEAEERRKHAEDEKAQRKRDKALLRLARRLDMIRGEE